ncbi:hypothetical protein NMG60_11006379 [Bertholletia excelsa]
MASHHHCRRPVASVPSSFCCCGACYPTCCATPPPPESLLHHALPLYSYSHYANPPYDSQIHSFPHHHQTPYQQQTQVEFRRHDYDPHEQQTQPAVSSLLRRIAALESSLRGQLSVKSPGANSLRDAAARTIQTHFRAFLARRSRTLRQLKDLAFIKSKLNALKASLSDNAYLDIQLLSHRATDLLLELDSIQGGDPMIRESKRSISRELIRLLELVDGASVKRNKVSSVVLKSARLGVTGNKSRVLYRDQKIGAANLVNSGGNEEELMKTLRSRVKKMQGVYGVSEEDGYGVTQLESPIIANNGTAGSSRSRIGNLVKRLGGDQTKIKKNVTFADNLDASTVFITSHKPNSSEDTNGVEGNDSSEDEPELMNNLDKEVHEIEEDEGASAEDGDSPRISDGERNHSRNFRAEDWHEICRDYQGANGNFVLSAPLPLKMESRADLKKGMKAEKTIN